MIVSRLIGGLGNQLFQYAAGRALAISKKEHLALDARYIEDNGMKHFENACLIPPKQLPPSKKYNPLKYFTWRHMQIGLPLFREKGREYDPKLFDCSANTYIQGYWHSYKYLDGITTELKSELKFTTPLNPSNAKMASRIRNSDNAVSIHIRRGDYLSFGIFNILGLDYYRRAIRRISENTAKPVTCFVFSNDSAWVKDNLHLDCETIFVDINDAKSGHMDLHLMSLCSHNIIANSTFSWWGAWLNSNPDKIIITPRKWFNRDDLEHDDICPPSWHRL